MDQTDEIAALLRSAGYKLTPQRMLIVRAMREASGHVTAAAIADRVHEQFPSVDVSTVYRTLDMLKQLGLVTVTDLGEGDMLFEWRREGTHHHLICVRCNAQSELGHAYLEPLAERLRAEFGFEAAMDHFAIFGVCRGCASEAGDGHAA